MKALYIYFVAFFYLLLLSFNSENLIVAGIIGTLPAR